MRGDFSCYQIANHDPFGMSIYKNQVLHFRSGIHFNVPEPNLATQGLVSSEEELLTCLSTRVEGSGNLRPTKRSVGKITAVFPRKRNPLSHALVDDLTTHLSQSVHIGFSCSEITAFDGVVKQTMHA